MLKCPSILTLKIKCAICRTPRGLRTFSEKSLGVPMYQYQALRPFSLELRVKGEADKYLTFPSVQALARALHRWVSPYRGRSYVSAYQFCRSNGACVFGLRDSFFGSDSRIEVVARSPRGRVILVEPLLASVRWVKASRGRTVEVLGGAEPVPRTGRKRSAYSRNPKTQAERRMNALVVLEEGEVGARPIRCARYLPSASAEWPRHVETCWKRQRKGRKAWCR